MNTAEVDLREIDPREVETDKQAVYDELDRLLSNQRFVGAPQMSAFLRYVVTQTLQGNGSRIKAYTIGVDALGKPGSFDAQNDPSVRVLALRLRKALKSIYETEQPSGAIIDIKLGSYAPEFYQHKVQPTKVVQIGEPTSRLPTTQISGSAMLGSSKGGLSEAQHQRDAAQSANSKQHGDTSAQYNSAAIAWNRIDVLKSAHVLLILSAVMYSIALKISGDTRQIGEILQSETALSDMPVRLLSVSKAATNSSGLYPVSRQVPSVFLATSDESSEQLNQISVLLSTTIVEISDIDVVRNNTMHQSPSPATTDYVIRFNEVNVDSRSQIDAQIYRLDNGEVIVNETLQFDNIRDGFSADEMSLIAKYAQSVSDSTGALNMDFCNRYAYAELARCKQNAS